MSYSEFAVSQYNVNVDRCRYNVYGLVARGRGASSVSRRYNTGVDAVDTDL